MKIIFFGAPGAGKGTQAEIVSEKLAIPAISTGNIIREAIKTGTEMGKSAKSYIEKGALVPDDVVIGICFPRYSELALKTIQFARDRGATIVGVTDSEMSPINQMSSNSLLVRSEMISFVDSLAAPMSMLNALILAVANKKGADISATFSELEHTWERFDIFGKIEDE